MKILCIIGRSQYGSVRRFVLEIAEQMTLCGMQVTILDGTNEREYYKQRKQVIQQNFDVVFSINGMLLDQEESLNVLLKNKPLYCVYLMDHPAYHYKRLMTKYPYVLVLTPDRYHMRYVDDYLENIYATSFLPHGGCCLESDIYWVQRLYDITFMGSYTSPDKVREQFQKYPLFIAEMMRVTAEKMLKCCGSTLETTVEHYLEEHEIKVSKEEFIELINECRVVDKYVRAVSRDKVIRTLVEAEIKVHVFGDGWGEFICDSEKKKYLVIHSRLNYEESLNIVTNSKISLNVMPWFKDGSHDRVISAMLCGAVCLTDDSKWLQEEFQEGDTIYYYSLNGIKYLPAKVKSILESPEKSEKVAMNGKRIAQQRHTWAHRALEVLDYCSIVLENINNEKERKKYFQQVFIPNIYLIKKICSVKKYYYKQQFLYGTRKMREIIDDIIEVLPKYIWWSNKNNVFIGNINEKDILEGLNILTIAQEKKDYIYLTDILEQKWLSLLYDMQEKYILIEDNKEIKRENYIIERSRCGAYTIASILDGKKRYLHSVDNPYEEAQILAESWFDVDHYDYIVYGLGLGYHIQALLEIDEAICVIVIETDPNILSISKDYGEIYAEEYLSRIQIVDDRKFNLFPMVLEQNKQAKVVVHYPSLLNMSDCRYKKWLEHYFIEYTSANTQAARLNGNFVRNVPIIKHEVTELLPQFISKTVYIIAAGPSLDRNIEQLRKISKEEIILATGTVLKKLCNIGIIPDYVIIIDGGASTFEQTKGITMSDVPLLYLPTVYHKILTEYPGKRYVVCQAGFEKSEIYASEHGYPLYQSGGSVTTTALDVMIRLQVSRVVFVGLDLAYTQNRSHAEDTAGVRGIQGNCMVCDIYGKMIPSAKNLEVYRNWIEKRIILPDAKNIEFIDATEGGAMIRGTKVMKLEDIVKNVNEQ